MDSFAVLPEAKFTLALGVREPALPMLPAFKPLAIILLAVRPLVATEAVLLLKLVLTLITTAVRPRINAFSMHFTQLPLAFVIAAIGPAVLTLTFDFIIGPASRVARTVGPLVTTLPVLFAFHVAPLVHATVHERLLSETMLRVVLPVTFKSLPGRVYVNTVAVRSVMVELTRVCVPIRVVENSLSLSLVVSPVAIVARPIFPLLHALPVLYPDMLSNRFIEFLLHLTRVDGAIFHLHILMPC